MPDRCGGGGTAAAVSWTGPLDQTLDLK